MVSTRIIAEKCGVSLGTVSRVLNNKSNVNEETRQKVLRAFREYKYDPLAAVPLVRQQADITYGLVLPHLNPGVHSEFLNRAVSRFFNLGADPSQIRRVLIPMRQLRSLLVDRAADPRTMLGVGRILMFAPTMNKSTEILEALRSWEIPTVLINRRTDLPGIPVIHSAEPQGTSLALEHLSLLGHRRLAMVAANSSFQTERTGCFERFAREKDAGYTPDRILPLPITDGTQTLGGWVLRMYRDEGVTAFVCAGDEFAARVVGILAEAGIDVPGKVSVTGYNNDAVAELLNPPLTTVNLPVEKMVETGFMLLNSASEWNRTEKTEMVVQPELVVRGSTGPVSYVRHISTGE